MDLAGRTAMPGMVGIHDHMFYPSPYGETGRVAGVPTIYNEMGVSFPRLYLAGGATSVRTTGTLEPYSDLQLKMAIDSGRIPGPQMYVTGPYLEGAGNLGMVRMHWLSGPEDAARTVNYWADEGVHDFRAYMHITRAELAAAVKAAHARGLKVTGHLCAVGFTEAANIGIDDLEHGLPVDTEFDPGKEPDVCPGGMSAPTGAVIAALDLQSAPVQAMLSTLIDWGDRAAPRLKRSEKNLRHRSAAIGSIRVARRAGTYPATMAATRKARATTEKVRGSVGPT
jgi:imidazolonepropionase-like amidohydrolase